MKKTLTLLLALVMVFALAACGNNNASAPAGSADDAASSADGSVYWLNFKPESDEVLQQIASMYTEKTGVPVTVLTAASGTYNETLQAEMDKTAAVVVVSVREHHRVDGFDVDAHLHGVS